MKEQDEFIERLKAEAAHLAFDPDDETIDRVTRGIRQRMAVARGETVSIVMSRWFAPAAVLFAIIIGLGTMAMTTLDEPTSLFADHEAVFVQEVQDGTIR